MSATILSLGARSPDHAHEGLRISGDTNPLTITIGIADPTAEELAAIQQGSVVHNFGANAFTAWMTLRFYLDDELKFWGDVFHTACKFPSEYTDDKLAKLRDDLPEGIGLFCVIILVNTVDQRIVALRPYSWSHEMSRAFVDAAEKTRHAAITHVDFETKALMELYSTEELSRLATIRFELNPVESN
jgi:hypothetical protein